jgi:hypothetical protein
MSISNFSPNQFLQSGYPGAETTNVKTVYLQNTSPIRSSYMIQSDNQALGEQKSLDYVDQILQQSRASRWEAEKQRNSFVPGESLQGLGKK